MQAFGKWEACFDSDFTTGVSSTVTVLLGFVTPGDTNDPMGSLDASEYDTSSVLANMYLRALVYKVTVVFKIININISELFYFWAVIESNSTSPIATGDNKEQLCEEPRLKWMLVKSAGTLQSSQNFRTLKYTYYTKEYMKSRFDPTIIWPQSAEHLLNTTAPAFNPHIHFGITAANGTVFTDSLNLFVSTTLHIQVSLHNRKTIGN